MSELGDDAVVRSVEGLIEGRSDGRERCLNCDAPLRGEFCSRCGQKAAGIDISLREFGREALDSLFSFDSRVWRTLRLLLLRPGFLTVEYWEGRRARYVAPLRLYLFVSFITFLVLSLGSPQVFVANADWEGESGGGGNIRVFSGQEGDEIEWEEEVADAPAPLRWFLLDIVRPLIENQERAEDLFLQRLPWAVFLMVPFFAALLKVCFRKPKRFFVAHLVFSLHLHALVFIVMAVGEVADRIFETDVLSAVASLAIFAGLVVSLRRAYENGWIRTILKALLIVFVHMTVLGFAMLFTIALTALAL